MRPTILTAAILVSATSAQAAVTVVAPQGGTALAGSGLVSARPGVLTENFNSAASPTACGVQDTNAITILGAQSTPGLYDGNYDLASTTAAGKRLQPAGDTSCFLSLGSSHRSEDLPIQFNAATTLDPLVYLGFYWGSMDEYNSISFLDTSGNIVLFADGSASMTGEQIAYLLGYPQYVYGVPPYPNAFVEFTFLPTDAIGEVIFSTTNYAFELDNLAYQFQTANIIVAAPEPTAASLAVMGLGLGLMTQRRRRSRA